MYKIFFHPATKAKTPQLSTRGGARVRNSEIFITRLRSVGASARRCGERGCDGNFATPSGPRQSQGLRELGARETSLRFQRWPSRRISEGCLQATSFQLSKVHGFPCSDTIVRYEASVFVPFKSFLIIKPPNEI